MLKDLLIGSEIENRIRKNTNTVSLSFGIKLLYSSINIYSFFICIIEYQHFSLLSFLLLFFLSNKHIKDISKSTDY